MIDVGRPPQEGQWLEVMRGRLRPRRSANTPSSRLDLTPGADSEAAMVDTADDDSVGGLDPMGRQSIRGRSGGGDGGGRAWCREREGGQARESERKRKKEGKPTPLEEMEQQSTGSTTLTQRLPWRRTRFRLVPEPKRRGAGALGPAGVGG